MPVGYDTYFNPRSFIRHLCPSGVELGRGRLMCGRELAEHMVEGGAAVQPVCKKCLRVASRWL